MKKIVLSAWHPVFVFISLFILQTEFTQGQIVQAGKNTSIRLLSDNGSSTSIEFDFGTTEEEQVLTPKGEAVTISVNKGTPLLRTGEPDLPKVSASIIIPDNKEMEVMVTGFHYTDYANVNVAPSKGTLIRTIDPSAVTYTYSAEVYDQDFFYPKSLAELRDPYILRDFRGQTVLVYPFQYNAASKTLRVYSDITVRISPKESGTPVNSFTRNKPFDRVQDEFASLYQHQFLNYNTNLSRYTPLNDHGNMLIICYDDFMDEIQPFADWKIQEGIKTEIVKVSEVGNDATAIKNYVSDYYNTHGLTFLLLVGDDSEVSTGLQSSGDSDNQYGYITGNDHYQEILVGRFSASVAEDVSTQVNRTIEYEKMPALNSYYSHGVAVASEFGAGIGDDGESDYDHERNIRNQLLGFTYTDIQELFDGDHPGGNDANGYPTDADLAALVNAGTGIINYTGHGDISMIVTTGFDNADVDGLTNTHAWPFIWTVGCQTGNFKYNTCFAEEWARHTYNGLPSGSVASFMSTRNQYWAEPMEMQDEGNNILAEAEANNIRRTFAGLSINGCFSMNDAYGQTGFDMTDTWLLFGDPSVMVRTAEPSAMSVTHDPQIILGSSAFSVSCDFDGAIVSITHNDTISGTATVAGGIANVTFDNPLLNADSVLITVTGFNKIPYINKIPTALAAGPYVINSSVNVTDAGGNNNGLCDYGETIDLDMTLQNVGVSVAQQVITTLSAGDPFITISDDTESYGDISGNSSIAHTGAFAFTVADNVPDQHLAYFTRTTTDTDNDTWASGFSFILNAPQPAVTGFTIDDSNGNNDGYPDPSENIIVNVSNGNTGHADGLNAIGSLSSLSPYVTIANPQYALGNLNVGSNSTASFNVTIAPYTPYGEEILFYYAVSAGNYSYPDSFKITVTPAIENFETGDFTKYDWQLNGNANWQTETYDVYEGQYAARLGIIGNNQSSTLLISLQALADDEISFMMKVSSEGNYDSLAFRIDNISMGHWSGEVGWTLKTYAVTEGAHTFEWKYQKDDALSMGYDCAYLDNIMLPVFQTNPVNNIPSVSAIDKVSCYPNPFSQLTFIDYSVRNEDEVTVCVFDVNGKLMTTVLNHDHQTPGNYHLGFDGATLPDGSYFCNITIGNQTVVRKLVVSK